MTYPYMHDWRFKNLREVILYYAEPKNFESSSDASLSKIGYLTEIQKKELHAFLLTLTDKEFLYDRRFADPGMHF